MCSPDSMWFEIEDVEYRQMLICARCNSLRSSYMTFNTRWIFFRVFIPLTCAKVFCLYGLCCTFEGVLPVVLLSVHPLCIFLRCLLFSSSCLLKRLKVIDSGVHQGNDSWSELNKEEKKGEKKNTSHFTGWQRRPFLNRRNIGPI